MAVVPTLLEMVAVPILLVMAALGQSASTTWPSQVFSLQLSCVCFFFPLATLDGGETEDIRNGGTEAKCLNNFLVTHVPSATSPLQVLLPQLDLGIFLCGVCLDRWRVEPTSAHCWPTSLGLSPMLLCHS